MSKNSFFCVITGFFLIFLGTPLLATEPLRPFPQSGIVLYTTESIRPNVDSKNVMDAAVASKWELWKKNYLKSANIGYYVKYNPKGETVSEAHGYGMILAVLMAGHDPKAKEYFDGLYAYYQNHPSQKNQYLMAWKQNSNFENIGGPNSATDGDMDIAYALLLADKQWGSASINYLEAAKNMINAIMVFDVNQTQLTLKLGDWAIDGVRNSAGQSGDDMRPSDFMLNHLRIFGVVSQDPRWVTVMNNTYGVINTMHSTYSPNTGLLPDFIVRQNQTDEPAWPGYLEGLYDGDYYYNSSRTPWRIATDYLVSGDTTALSQLYKMNEWIKNTAGSPANIKAGYELNGVPLPNSNYQDRAFIAPFGVSAMIDPENQQWLNALWTKLKEPPYAPLYYQDSIELFSMIVMSGNWWHP